MAGDTEVKAQIRLQFRDITGQKCMAIRSLVASQKVIFSNYTMRLYSINQKLSPLSLIIFLLVWCMEVFWRRVLSESRLAMQHFLCTVNMNGSVAYW